MIASLDDSTSLENYDVIRLADCLETVCHDDDGTTLEQLSNTEVEFLRNLIFSIFRIFFLPHHKPILLTSFQSDHEN